VTSPRDIERALSAARTPMTTRDPAAAIGETSRARMQKALDRARADGAIRIARVTRGPTGFVNYEWEAAGPRPRTIDDARRTA